MPYLVFGICLAGSFALLFLLPETLGRPIPQTLVEVVGPDAYKHLVNENEVHTGLVSSINDRFLLKSSRGNSSVLEVHRSKSRS